MFFFVIIIVIVFFLFIKLSRIQGVISKSNERK